MLKTCLEFHELHNLQYNQPNIRLAKIDLVMIFDCYYQWYRTIDYVIVNYIGPIIFSIIFNDFLAINHLLSLIEFMTPCGEYDSVLEL